MDLTKGPWNYLNLPTEKHFPAHAIRSMDHVKERGQQWGEEGLQYLTSTNTLMDEITHGQMQIKLSQVFV